MGIFIKNKSNIIAAGAAALICILMVVCADIAVLSAKKGISLWVSNVLPALFPFFVCVNFLAGTGTVRLLPLNLFPFTMSVLAGYPMGVKIVGDMYRDGLISGREAKSMVSFCSTSGPVFMVGAVGAGMLGSQTAGIVIAVSHYAAAVINGVFFSDGLHAGRLKNSTDKKLCSYDILETMTASVYAACRSMAVILAYIILFMFVMDLMDTAGAFGMIRSDILECLLRGSLEMTVGCNSVAASDVDLRGACVLASVIVSWGGLSVLGQSMSMLAGTGISFLYFVITKLTHSFFAGIIALFIGKLML